MVEKRFNQMCASNDYCIGWDNKLDEGLSIDDTIEMLNKLSEENEQLKSSDTITDLETEVMKLKEENEQLKQSIKEIDDAELHLKQIILKRIDDYIWEWEDEGTPVAQVLRELRDEIKGDVE